MGVILRTHPIRGKSHIQCNASGEVTTVESAACSNVPNKISGGVSCKGSRMNVFD